MNKFLIIIGFCFLALIGLLFLNPFNWNDAGYRTVVTRMNGSQFVQFQPGVFYAGFMAKEVEWPNQLSVSYRENEAKDDLDGSMMEIGKIPIRFSGGPQADMMGIVQFILPNDEIKMLNIHNTHKFPTHLVKNRLMPYTRACLQSSSQLLTVQNHYEGGRAQLGQDYLDQLQHGEFLLEVKEITKRDSNTNEFRTSYVSSQKRDTNGNIKRKYSSIDEYGITVADAQITDTDYSEIVDSMINKNIKSVTMASVSKQDLITAQQQALTAKAQGERELVTIEYDKKKEQTASIVAANTTVELAKLDLIKQKIAKEGAIQEGAKIKILADANAYEKAKLIQADGALTQKLAAWTTAQEYWAKAFGEYQGAIVPQMQMGGNSTGNENSAVRFMEIMGMKAARDLNLELKNK
jgi:hypothetical protein